MKKSIYVDVSKCLACNSCVFACAVAHSETKDPVAAMRESPRPKPRVHLESVAGVSIPVQCRHCEDAPCVAICPTGAIRKLGPQEPVLIDQEKCIGCKFCIVACPFGAMTLTNDGRAALKCDRCVDRQKEGKLPACVEACPTGAMQFLTVDEINAIKRKLTAQREAAAVAAAGKLVE